MDDIIVFRSLTRDDLREIVKLELAKIMSRLISKEVELVVSPQAIEVVIDRGYNPDFGARPLKRALELLLEDPLSEKFLRGHLKSGRVMVGAEGDHLCFDQEVAPEAAPEEKAPTPAKT